MVSTFPGPEPTLLNIVAFIYRWALRRYARDKVNPPLEIEELLSSRKGTFRPRLVVGWILSLQNLEIFAVTLGPGAVLVAIGTGVRETASAWSSVLWGVGAFIGTVPVGLLLSVGLWTLVPDKRKGGFLRYPDRLRGPSVGTWLVMALVGLGFGTGPPLS